MTNGSFLSDVNYDQNLKRNVKSEVFARGRREEAVGMKLSCGLGSRDVMRDESVTR